MECSRCGKCCFGPFYKLVRPSDLEMWEREGRRDLIDYYKEEIKSDDRSNPEMAALGLYFHTCKFIRPESPGRFFCSIYEHRPETCRLFEVGCSKICVNYQDRPNKI